MACGGCEAARRAREARERAAAERRAQQAAQRQQAQQQQQQQPQPTSGVTQTFALQLRDGRVLRFGSRLEAEAANVRAGYTGTVLAV